MAVGLTHDEYINKLKDENPNIDTTAVKYVNSRGKVSVSCKTCNHSWVVTAGLLIGKNRTGCRRCSLKNRKPKQRITPETWVTRCNKKYNNKYTYDISKYVDQNTPTPITCPEHGVFMMKPVQHLHYSGCRTCGKYSGSPVCTTEVIKARILEKFSGRYLVDAVRYITQHNPILLTCKEHGIFTTTTKQLFNGGGCVGCSYENQNDMVLDKFIKTSTATHAGYYDYSAVSYVNSTTNVSIGCPIHGVFEQRPDTHMRGHGCSICGNVKNTLSQEEFVNRVNELHPEIILDSKSIYVRGDLPVTVRCKKHGHYSKLATELMRKPIPGRVVSDCPICTSSQGELRLGELLDSLRLEYVREYKLPNNKYRYDFYILELNILVEYDGVQHYRPVDIFGGVKAYHDIVISDGNKELLAELNNIPLIRIPYTHLKDIVPYFLWCLYKQYKYKYNNVYYKTYMDLIKNNKLPGDATPTSLSKYKVTNLIKDNTNSPVSNDTEKASS